MLAPMLFRGLLIFIWNHEVIHDALDSCSFVIKVILMLLDTFLASEEDKTIA